MLTNDVEVMVFLAIGAIAFGLIIELLVFVCERWFKSDPIAGSDDADNDLCFWCWGTGVFDDADDYSRNCPICDGSGKRW